METKDLGAAHALGMGQAPHTAAIELAEVDAEIIDWATEVKETGESDLLIKIAPGLRTIADELERQATLGLAEVLRRDDNPGRLSSAFPRLGHMAA